MRPVRVISPYPPGSSADIIGRIYSPRLTDALGKQFVVDNPCRGASGNIAAPKSSHVPHPDGYTLLLLNTSIVASQPLYKGLPFDIARDFQSAGMLGIAAYVLAVNQSVPVKSVQELIAYAKARAGKLIYASTGIGGGLHLTMELFKMQTGTQMLHVPYKGTSTAVPRSHRRAGRCDVRLSARHCCPTCEPAASARWAFRVSSAVLPCRTCRPSRRLACPALNRCHSRRWPCPTGTPRGVITRLNTVDQSKRARSAETITALGNQSTEPIAHDTGSRRQRIFGTKL